MAFASSHILYPLGIGRLYSQLSQLPDHPWGLPCSASRRCRRRRVPLCPGGGLSCRGADYRAVPPLHVPFWSEPISRFGSFDFTRFAGVHRVTHSVFPLARAPGAAPRGQYFSACFTPLRYQRRMTPMRRGGQDRLGRYDHSFLTTFTSHLEAVSCSALFGLDDVRTSPPSYQLRCFSRGATTGSEPFVSATAMSRAGRDRPSSVSASVVSFHRLIGRRTCLKAHSATRLPCVRPSTSGLRKWIPE